MHVAIDIETTGLTAHDEITAIGIMSDDSLKLVYQSDLPLDEHTAEETTTTIGEVAPQADVDLIFEKDERNLIGHAGKIINDLQKEAETHPDGDRIRLVGYYSAKFDIPFLRTRSLLNGVDFPLRGCESLDLYHIFKYKLFTDVLDCSGLNKTPLRDFGEEIGAPVDSSMNKTPLAETIKDHGFSQDELKAYADENGYDVPTKSLGSLEDLHSLFCPAHDKVIDYDPFDDSEEAVEAYNEGRIDEVMTHCAVDLQMTKELLPYCLATTNSSEIKTRHL